MKYVKHCDYDYIMGKYHDQDQLSKSLDAAHGNAVFNRFIRRDEIFDANTGMQGDDIIKGINEQDEKIIELPHPVRKAKALDYVLKNTRISCDKCDIFPAVNMVDRPLAGTLIAKWRWWVFNKDIPDVEKKRAQLERDGIVTIWPDYDHSVPVWSRLFSLGFSGIVEESEKIRYSKERNADEDAFFEGVKLSYEAVISLVGRLEELAKNTSGSEKMAKALGNIRKDPPKTFYEALLLSYIFHRQRTR